MTVDHIEIFLEQLKNTFRCNFHFLLGEHHNLKKSNKVELADTTKILTLKSILYINVTHAYSVMIDNSYHNLRHPGHNKAKRQLHLHRS